MKSLQLISEDQRLHGAVRRALAEDEYRVWWAPNAETGIELLGELPVDLVIAEYITPEPGEQNVIESLRSAQPKLKLLLTIEHGTPEIVLKALRARVCDFLISPFTPDDLRAAIDSAISKCPAQDIEVVSAQPEWVELCVPCDRTAFKPLHKLLDELDIDVQPELAEAIKFAFSEMLGNAIEHGGNSDPGKRVTVNILRLKHAVICRIKDPGAGFDPARLEHAAVNNPADDPLHHGGIREQNGLRPGGFGILLTKQLVDDLIYNERHNELMFVRFLS
ncbi:MAG TPA: ATP-binding protein [Pyrinomonadaceae bacterium]|jgi:anti-sigma regulatory factor (Ser/Thr protein kinase)/CheY-like chemotaxis protein|nr:ATP-binding protein [Pyrinomonadaceae bacterium]